LYEVETYEKVLFGFLRTYPIYEFSFINVKGSKSVKINLELMENNIQV